MRRRANVKRGSREAAQRTPQRGHQGEDQMKNIDRKHPEEVEGGALSVLRVNLPQYPIYLNI